MPFKKIKKETASEKVAQQLRTNIENGVYKVGDKIPSERELCELMSVSRIAVREAIKGLAARNFLEVRTGEGTYVKSYEPHDVVDPLAVMLMQRSTLRELLEFRWIIEVELAGMAAQRATDEQLKIIEEKLHGMQEDVEQYKDYHVHDMEFHNAIAGACDNNILAGMLNHVGELIREAMRKTVRTEGAFTRAYKIHADIFEQIKNHNVQGAREAMIAHLVEVERSLKQADEENKKETCL